MTLPHIVMWLVVAVVGIPSAWRNPTAAALVLCWIFSEGLFAFTGRGLAVEYYSYPDCIVLAVIFAKPEHCNQGMYQSTWHQFKCLLIERSPSDRAVMLIFPVMWWAYVADIHDFYRYWILWGGAILQFLFASSESIELFWRARREQITPSSSDNISRFAWAGGDG